MIRNINLRRAVAWILAGAATLLFAFTSLQLQPETSLARLEIAFWPEYDRPEVLVIYRATLPAEVPLPTQVALPIPARVGEPFAVARVGPDGSLLNAPFTRQVQGETAIITIETDSALVWLEFYDGLTFEGQERRYAFEWPGGMAVGEVSYEVQRPVGAGGMQISPASEFETIKPDGLTYLAADLGPLASSRTLTITFSYQRSIEALSADLAQPQGALGRPEATERGTAELWQALPWALAAVATAAAFGILFAYLRSRNRPARVRRPRRPPEKASEVGPGQVFCHNCGAPAGAADRFCRRCGMQLRR